MIHTLNCVHIWQTRHGHAVLAPGRLVDEGLLDHLLEHMFGLTEADHLEPYHQHNLITNTIESIEGCAHP